MSPGYALYFLLFSNGSMSLPGVARSHQAIATEGLSPSSQQAAKPRLNDLATFEESYAHHQPTADAGGTDHIQVRL